MNIPGAGAQTSEEVKNGNNYIKSTADAFAASKNKTWEIKTVAILVRTYKDMQNSLFIVIFIITRFRKSESKRTNPTVLV